MLANAPLEVSGEETHIDPHPLSCRLEDLLGEPSPLGSATKGVVNGADQ